MRKIIITLFLQKDNFEQISNLIEIATNDQF